MRRLVHVLALLAAARRGDSRSNAPAPAPHRRLEFSPPVLLGPAGGTASGYWAVSPTVFIGTSGGVDSYLSTDGGAGWAQIPRNADWV